MNFGMAPGDFFKPPRWGPAEIDATQKAANGPPVPFQPYQPSEIEATIPDYGGITKDVAKGG